MEISQDEDEIHVNNGTWNKIHENATKTGFREGISDGRDKNFQNSFDEGYREGFRNGLALGLYKAATKSLTPESISDENLQKTNRGNCEICKVGSEDSKEISDWINFQTESSNALLRNLKEKYGVTEGCIANLNLPDKLN